MMGLFATATLFTPPADAANKRAAAAAETARSARECTALGDFYWEIGDKNGVQASGQIGSEYRADTEMKRNNFV